MIDRFCLCDLHEHVDLADRITQAIARDPGAPPRCPFTVASALFWVLCETLDRGQDRFSVSAVLLELLRKRHERTAEHERLGALGFLVTDPVADIRRADRLKRTGALT